MPSKSNYDSKMNSICMSIRKKQTGSSAFGVLCAFAFAEKAFQLGEGEYYHAGGGDGDKYPEEPPEIFLEKKGEEAAVELN